MGATVKRVEGSECVSTCLSWGPTLALPALAVINKMDEFKTVADIVQDGLSTTTSTTRSCLFLLGLIWRH